MRFLTLCCLPFIAMFAFVTSANAQCGVGSAFVNVQAVPFVSGIGLANFQLVQSGFGGFGGVNINAVQGRGFGVRGFGANFGTLNAINGLGANVNIVQQRSGLFGRRQTQIINASGVGAGGVNINAVQGRRR